MMNRKINGFFAYVLLVLVLSACGHSIHEGKIIGKHYEPSRYYTYTTAVLCGKVVIPQTYTVYDDEDWVVMVQGINGKDTIIEYFYIDEAYWKCVSLGDVFNDSIPCITDDDVIK